MKPWNELRGIAWVILCLASGATAASVEGPHDLPRMGLREFLLAAEKNGGQLGEERAKVEFAESRLDYAKSKGYPSGSITSVLSAAPGAEGNAIEGRTLWNKWGPISFNKIEIIQPIYTFGALSSGVRAAKAGVAAERGLLERERWALRTQVTEYYYGYQLAFEFSELVNDVSSKIEEALKKGQKFKHKKQADLDKLSIYLTEVRVRLGEAQKGMDEARIGMAWKIGTYGEQAPHWDRANLEARQLELKDLAYYHRLAMEYRPELKALASEVEAKQALVGVEEGLRMPSVFLAGDGVYAIAPNRPYITAPYAYDPANQRTAGIGVGVKWDVDFFEKNAKVGQARAEAAEAVAKQRHLNAGIFAEVEKNYLDLRDAQRSLGLRVDGSKTARRLYEDTLVAYGLGTGNAKDLLEALGSFTLSEKARFEALYNVDVEIAHLEQSVGVEL